MFVPPIRRGRSKADVRNPKAAPRPPIRNDRPGVAEATLGVSWNFAETPVFPPASRLLVGAADDPLEREADRAADPVTDAPKPIHARPAGRAPATSEVAVPKAVSQVLGEPGRPLDGATRASMESRFRLDFSRIRVHADARAASAAGALDARAFAAGTHVVIDPAEAGGERGRRLLAHELAHTAQQRSFAAAGLVVQRQQRGGLRLALPKAEIKAIGNADVNQIVDAFPAAITNGQTFNISITTADGTQRTFAIEITITPGAPPVTSPSAAKTKKKPMPPGSSAPPTFAIQIFQMLPDPVRTLYHEFLHLRLGIDRELPEDQRSDTFGRYNLQFQMATDEAVLRATGAFDLKKAVMDKIAAVRSWFETFVAGFKTPAPLSAAKDDEFLQHFIEEKFANQEAAAAKISPGGKKPAVTAPITTATIASRYAGTVAEVFRAAANVQGLQGAVAAAENRARESTLLPSLDDLKTQLAGALQKLFDALDAQLAQIAAFKQQPGPTTPPKQLGPQEQVDEALRTQPPLRLPP